MKFTYVTVAGETVSEHQTNEATAGAASAHWENEVAAHMSEVTSLTNKWADGHTNAKSHFNTERVYIDLEPMPGASS